MLLLSLDQIVQKIYNLITLKDIFEFMNEKSIKNLDLIKINIEGGEYQVLNRLIDTNLVKNIKNILVQFHDIDSSSKSERDLIRKKIKKDSLL